MPDNIFDVANQLILFTRELKWKKKTSVHGSTPLLLLTKPAEMSSPAALLAQKHRDLAETPAVTASAEVAAATPAEPAAEPEKSDFSQPKRDLQNNKLFPSLGNKGSKPASGVSGTSSWGRGAASSLSAASSNSAVASTASDFKPAVKSSTSQTTFIIDDDKQKELSQQERFKILSAIQNMHNVKIESTYSSTTKKRTFLLTGSHQAVISARKDVLRQITKPTTVEFTIPSKLRSAVIGQRGKTINPIIQSTGVQIDIAKDEDEPEWVPTTEEEKLFGRALKVSISGDMEGCAEAKAQIMRIIDENSKSLNVKLPLKPELKPFVELKLESLVLVDDKTEVVVGPSALIISGSRDSILTTKSQVEKLIESIEINLVTMVKKIPVGLHDFLDIDEIFSKTNVQVVLPKDSESLEVKFVGLSSDINKGIELAKSQTDKVVVDVLNLGKSHGGKVAHAKNLIAFLAYTKSFDAIGEEFGVSIKGASTSALLDEQNNEVLVTITGSKDKLDSIKKARKSIVDLVNKIPPSYVKTVEGIEPFLFGKINRNVSVQENVSIVPFGDKLVLVAQQSDDDEFLPSQEEIDARLKAVEESLDDLLKVSSSLVEKSIELDSNDQLLLKDQLHTFLNKFDSDSLQIQLQTPTEGQISLKGSKSVIEDAISQISGLIEEIKNYEEASKYNTTITFPKKLLARFIGQRGTQLNELSQDFNVKIDVYNEDSASEAEIKLTGLKSNVDELIKKIDSLNKKWSDEVTSTVKMDQKYQRTLIGPNGIYINRLQDKYHVNIKLQKGDSQEVIIRGPSRGVAKAEEEINMLIEYEKENGHKETIQVSKKSVGNIVGKKGETLNDITADCGVSIDIGDQAGDKVDIEIVGSKKGIREAINMIKQIESKAVNYVHKQIEIDPKWYRQLIGPGGSIKRDIMVQAGGDESDRDFRRLLQFPSQDSKSHIVKLEGDSATVDKIEAKLIQMVADFESIVEDSIEIEKSLHWAVIGPMGSSKQAVEQEFNVRINIPHKDKPQTAIVIRGTPENIAKTKEKLLKMVEGKKK